MTVSLFQITCLTFAVIMLMFAAYVGIVSHMQEVDSRNTVILTDVPARLHEPEAQMP